MSTSLTSPVATHFALNGSVDAFTMTEIGEPPETMSERADITNPCWYRRPF
jgi:hypothetical protein